MALLRRLQTVRALYGTASIPESLYMFGSSRSYSSVVSNVPRINYWSLSSCSYKGHNGLPWACGSKMTLRTTMSAELLIFLNDKKSVTTQAKTSAQARKMGAQVSMTSPGFVYEPYAPHKPISFWQRYFTKSGWRRTKEDIILELKSAYAIAKLRKTGYSKKKFYIEAIELFKEGLKNEIKQRESMWTSVFWEMVEPVVKIRTLRARLIGVDRNDHDKVFIQLTLEFLTKQKFEAYDSNGTVVAGDKNKEVLVGDIWVFEKSLFHSNSYWRLCGRISL